MSKFRRPSRSWKSWLSTKKRPSRSTARRLFSENLEGRVLLAADVAPIDVLRDIPQAEVVTANPYHNTWHPTDVNGDSSTSPLDALTLVNELVTGGSRQLLFGSEAEGSGQAAAAKLDVNNDTQLSPIDLLQVVNAIGEGESGMDVIELQVLALSNPVEAGPLDFVNGQIVDARIYFSTEGGNNTIRRGDGSWTADGFGVGDEILISDSGAVQTAGSLEVFDERNNGLFTISAISANGDTLTVQQALDTTNARDSSDNTTEFIDENAKVFRVLTSVGLNQEFNLGLVATDLRMLQDLTGADAPVGGGRPNGELGGPFQAAVEINLPESVQITTTTQGQGNDQTTHVNATAHNFFGLAPETEVIAPGTVVFGDARSGTNIFAPTGPGEQLVARFPASINTTGTTTIGVGPTADPVAINLLYNQDPLKEICDGANDGDCVLSARFVSTTVINVSTDVDARDDTFNVNEDSTGNVLNVLADNGNGVDAINNPSGETPVITRVIPSSAATISGSTLLFDAPASGNQVTFDYEIRNSLGVTDTATVTVNIIPQNDTPVISVTNRTPSVNEDSSVALSGISVSDGDGDALTVDLTVSSGVLTLTESGTLTTFTGSGTSSVTLAGSTTDLNNTLGSLSYAPNADVSGSDTLSITAADSFVSDSDTVNITITPINDAPVNTVPGAQTLFNTDTLSFGTGAVQVEDVDASTLDVTLSVTQGTLQVTGGSASNTLNLSGTVSSINGQLNSLVYDPTDTFVGDDTLTVVSSDSIATDTDTVTLTVVPPTIPFAAGDTFNIEEDTSSATDLDVLGNDLVADNNTLNIIEFNGTALSGSTSITTNNGGTLSYDAGRSVFTYVPQANFFGTETFTYTIESTPDSGDGMSTGTATINVQAINDAPVNTVPGSQSLNEDASLPINGISVSDIDSGTSDITVSLSVSDGVLGLASSSLATGNNTGSVTITGTVSQVNSALGGLTYTPDLNFSGGDQLRVETNDQGNTGGAVGNPGSANPLSDVDTINITVTPVNDVPVLTVPGDQTGIVQSTPHTVNGGVFQVEDVDSNNLTVNLQISGGSITANGQTSTSVNFSGTASQVNTILTDVVFQSANPGDFTLAVSVNDNDGGNASDTVNLNVIDTVVFDVTTLPTEVQDAFTFMIESPQGNNAPSIEFGGIDIQITSSTETMTVRTGANGVPEAVNLTPGTTYQVDVPALPGTNFRGRSFPLTVNVDGTFTAPPQAPLEILPTERHAQINELFGNHEASGLLFGAFGTDVAWFSSMGSDWDRARYTHFDLAIAADGNSATLSVFDSTAGEWMDATVAAGDDTFYYRGDMGERVYRLTGGPGAFSFTADPARPAPEGEAAADAAITSLFGR